MEQTGRLRIGEEVRPGVDVVLGEKAEVETLCPEAHRASIEAAETILRP